MNILTHHITLRSKESLLSLLSGGTNNPEQGLFVFLFFRSHKYFSFILASHLCDTKSCISEEHLIVETQEENTSRRDCFDVLIEIHQNNFGAHYITKTKPCIHGRKLKNSNIKEQLEHSCRKIRTTILTDEDIKYYK